MGFAQRMNKVATKLLTKYDESDSANRRIKLIIKGVPAWDAELAEFVQGMDSTVDLVGVTVPFSADLIDGTTIQSGDVTAIVTTSAQPKIGDKVQIDGEEWSIVDMPLVNYTGVPICHKLHCRK